MRIIRAVLIFILLLSASNIHSQNNLPRLSPKSFVGQTIGYANVVITYGAPGVKERTIWGDLVEYNKVWRTGANEATTFEFDKDVLVEGNLLPSGKYSLFTIPGEKLWTIILNKIDDQWGAYKYESKEDLLRFKVAPKVGHFVERLSFGFEYMNPYQSNVKLAWGKLLITFEINSQVKNKKD